MKFKMLKNESGQITGVERVKDLSYWRENAEEDYLIVPISVLKYISKLETELETVYSEESKDLFEVKKEKLIISGESDYFNYDDGKKLNINVGKQESIIPKEDPEYIFCGEANKFYRCVNCDSSCGIEGHYVENQKPSKETLEEAAKNSIIQWKKDNELWGEKNNSLLEIDSESDYILGFKNGYKVSQERSYSEEEAYTIWKAGQEYWKTSGESITFEELTEQFKKK